MKMFKNNFFRVFCFLLIISSFSCKKFLDLKPQDGIIRQNFWKTKEQVQAAVNGCYASLLGAPSGVSDRPLPEYLFLWGELRGDLLAPTTGVTTEETDIMNVNILPSNGITNWRSVYRTINYCNTVIDFAPEVLTNDPTFSQQALDASLAEVKALRALMYFYLVRSFRDVPLVVKSTSSDEELVQIPKNTAAEVLDQIVKDLSEAEKGAVLTYNNTASDKGRITRYTVNAIQADVYLWMEKYPEAAAACDKIINSGKFGLVSGLSQNSWFTTLYVNGNSAESIFEIQFDRNKLNSFYTMFRSRPRFFASSAVTDPLSGIYQADINDITKFDIRGDGAAARFSDGLIWKYIAVSSNTETSSSIRAAEESFAHWIVYRFADVLLMKAEALALTGQGKDALDLVDRIRTRAHALPQTARTPDVGDTEGICDYILEERAREFAYEGKRWYDVLRHAKRNNYKRLDILLNLVSKTVSSDKQQSAIAKYKDPNSHYFPIYQYELQTDKNLVQNPFYK
jgi:starch-binding outer membrane protein, SusD/RagB family